MKKKEIVILSVLFAFVFLFGGIVFAVARVYQKTGLSLAGEWEESYSYNGKFLLSPDGENALVYRVYDVVHFESNSKKAVDLTPFGFAGEKYEYFEIDGRCFSPESGYEGFWPVSDENRFVYLDSDGKKYAIHPKEGLCYPMFSDSIDGVDVYGEDVLAFSSVGSYALALRGDVAVIYKTDPMDASLRIVETKEVELSQYGTNIRFGAFVGVSQAYFYVENKGVEELIALDCATGNTARSLVSSEEPYGPVLDRLYAQKLEAENKDGEEAAAWVHLLLGEEKMCRKTKGYSDFSLLAVSPDGNYAVANAKSESGQEVLVMSEKRSFSLTSVLSEGERVKDVDFVFKNVIFVTLQRADGTSFSRAYNILF